MPNNRRLFGSVVGHRLFQTATVEPKRTGTGASLHQTTHRTSVINVEIPHLEKNMTVNFD